MKNTGNVVTLVVLSWCFIGSVSTWASGLSSDTPTVRVDSGEIAGNYEYTNLSGRRLYSFLGVPYASPPVQNNRFKVVASKNYILLSNRSNDARIIGTRVTANGNRRETILF